MPASGGTSFETEHMLQLYRYGHDKARSGLFWETKPPQLEGPPSAEPEITSPRRPSGQLISPKVGFNQ